MGARRSKWFPVAAILSALNLGSVWFAARPAEPTHATVHAALALAFGLWAMHLWSRGRDARGLAERLDEVEAFRALETEVGTLREALAESQAALVAQRLKQRVE